MFSIVYIRYMSFTVINCFIPVSHRLFANLIKTNEPTLLRETNTSIRELKNLCSCIPSSPHPDILRIHVCFCFFHPALCFWWRWAWKCWAKEAKAIRELAEARAVEFTDQNLSILLGWTMIFWKRHKRHRVQKQNKQINKKFSGFGLAYVILCRG